MGTKQNFHDISEYPYKNVKYSIYSLCIVYVNYNGILSAF